MTAEIAVVGAGAYVDRDRYGPGVVARSVVQWCLRNGGAEAWTLRFFYNRPESRARIQTALSEVFDQAGGRLALEMSPASEVESRLPAAHALLVSVPDDAHERYVMAGVSAGVPVWVVKPLTGSPDATRRIVAAANAAQAAVWVDYHKRFDVSNRDLRARLAEGSCGPPLLFSVRYSQPRDLPLEAFSWARDLNVFTYIGCHYVDLLAYLLPGARAERCSARGVRGEVFRALGGQAYDLVVAAIDLEWRGHKLMAQFEVGWSNPLGSATKSLQVVEVTCERTRLFVDQTRRGLEVWDDGGAAQVNPYFFGRAYDPLQGRIGYQGYGYESIRQFLDFTCAASERRQALARIDALPWARGSVFVADVLEAARASLDQDGAWIPVRG